MKNQTGKSWSFLKISRDTSRTKIFPWSRDWNSNYCPTFEIITATYCYNCNMRNPGFFLNIPEHIPDRDPGNFPPIIGRHVAGNNVLYDYSFIARLGDKFSFIIARLRKRLWWYRWHIYQRLYIYIYISIGR